MNTRRRRSGGAWLGALALFLGMVAGAAGPAQGVPPKVLYVCKQTNSPFGGSGTFTFTVDQLQPPSGVVRVTVTVLVGGCSGPVNYAVSPEPITIKETAVAGVSVVGIEVAGGGLITSNPGNGTVVVSEGAGVTAPSGQPPFPAVLPGAPGTITFINNSKLGGVAIDAGPFGSTGVAGPGGRSGCVDCPGPGFDPAIDRAGFVGDSTPIEVEGACAFPDLFPDLPALPPGCPDTNMNGFMCLKGPLNGTTGSARNLTAPWIDDVDFTCPPGYRLVCVNPLGGRCVITSNDDPVVLAPDPVEPHERHAVRQVEVSARNSERQVEISERKAQRQAELSVRHTERQAEISERKAQRQAEVSVRHTERQAEISKRKAQRQAEVSARNETGQRAIVGPG